MNNDILGELKKVIRGLLIAEKSKGMQLRVLERKYRENEGRYMPLLGFPDTAALLYSLGDTVSVVCIIQCVSGCLCIVSFGSFNHRWMYLKFTITQN